MSLSIFWQHSLRLVFQRFPALRYRNFNLFLSGHAISVIGSWMQATVTPFLAYRLTGQPFDLGLVGFAGSIPAFFITLPGGVLIERLEKRKVVVICKVVMMLQAFTLAFLTLNGSITIWHLIALSFINGIANSLEVVGRQTMFIELVGQEALPSAIALNTTVFNAARVIGPSLLAPFLILFQETGEGWAYFANGVGYSFVIAGLLMIRLDKNALPKPKPAHPATAHGSVQDFLEGLRYVRQAPVIAMMVAMVAVPSLFAFSYTQLVPVFSRDILAQVGDTSDIIATRNSMMIAATGVGAFITAVVLAIYSNIKHKALLLTIGQFSYALGVIGLGISQHENTAFIFLILTGFGLVGHLTMTNTLIQLSVKDEVRSRVISIYFWAMQGLSPFGSLMMGGMAQALGAPAAVIIGSSICIFSYLIIHLIRPSMHRMKM